MTLLDIGATEAAALRDELRRLETVLRKINNTAAANDSLLLSLHTLAVFLIEKKDASWCPGAEAILRRGLKIDYCKIFIFSPAARLAKLAARLPAGGRVDGQILSAGEEVGKSRAFFHLPLKKNKKTLGLLALGDRRPDAFLPQDGRDFARRLAQLLTAAI